MDLTGTEIRYGMLAAANPSSAHVTGGVAIGTPTGTLVYSAAPNIAYSIALQIANGQSLVINTSTGNITGANAGVAQVTTANVTGTISAAGNASITFTSVITGTIIVPVAVLLSDSASAVATKIITALQANSIIAGAYTISGTTSNVVAAAIVKSANDSTLNIAIANGTAAGLTEHLTSTATTAGVMPTTASRINGIAWNAVDFEGVPLPSMSSVSSILIKHRSGTGTILVSNTAASIVASIPPLSVNLSAYGAANHPASATNLTFTATGDASIYLDIHAIY